MRALSAIVRYNREQRCANGSNGVGSSRGASSAEAAGAGSSSVVVNGAGKSSAVAAGAGISSAVANGAGNSSAMAAGAGNGVSELNGAASPPPSGASGARVRDRLEEPAAVRKVRARREPADVVNPNGVQGGGRVRNTARRTPHPENGRVASALRRLREVPVAGCCPHGCFLDHPSIICSVCESERRHGLIEGYASGAAPAPAVTCPHGCVLDHPFHLCSLCESERRD